MFVVNEVSYRSSLLPHVDMQNDDEQSNSTSAKL